MSRSDLISDALTIIRNAIMAKKENADFPASKTLKSILDILKKEIEFAQATQAPADASEEAKFQLANNPGIFILGDLPLNKLAELLLKDYEINMHFLKKAD